MSSVAKLSSISVVRFTARLACHYTGGANEMEDNALLERASTDWRKRRKDARYGHDAWKPMKRLSRDQMDHLKTLHSGQPETWTVTKLAEGFGISTSAVTRILRSTFEPSEETRLRQDASALKRRLDRRQKFTNENEK